MLYPGTSSKSFIMKIFEVDFRTGKVLTFPNNRKAIITKVYKYSLWRKLLNFFGIKFKLFNCIKVKPI